MKLTSKYYTSFFLLFLLSFCAFGQNSSQQGQFEVDYIKGCAPLTVQVTSTPNPPPGPNESIQYDYDYDPNEGFENTSATTYEYKQPGTYTIVQIIGTSGARRDSIKIEVMEPRGVDFSVYNCQNNAVSVEIRDDYYDSYTIDYGDGTGPTTDITHTYASQGSYNVTVRGIFSHARNNCGESIKSVTTTNILQPTEISTVEVLALDPDNGSVRLTYSLNPNTSYVLEMLTGNSGTPETIQIDNPDSVTIHDLNTLENYYCFTLHTLNPCNNARLPSATVCSMLLNATAENRENMLSWTPVADNYQVIRNGQTVASPPSGTQNYADSNIVCGQQYCYRIAGNKAVSGGTAKSISGEVCLTAISDETPPAIDNVTALVEGKNIQLTWDEPQGFHARHYIITRSEDGSAYADIDTVAANRYTDSGLATGRRQFCYKIRYTDECGKQSQDSLPACPVLLKGTQTSVSEAEISWSAYTGWKNPVKEYILEMLDENGQVLESFPAGLNTSLTVTFDEQTQVKLYRVKTFSADTPSAISYSNILRYVVPPRIFLPDAFTPNNDGLNDEFRVQGRYINQFRLWIFNRWGELLFRADNQETGWDGKVRGKEAPQGTYIYKYEMKDLAGQHFQKSGSFILLR